MSLFVDVIIFIVGIVVSVTVSYAVARAIFNQLFKKQKRAITVENTVKFQLLQQGLNYVLGFAIGSVLISPQLGLGIFVLWLVFQEWLALKIFSFKLFRHGFTFVAIDTLTDLSVAVAFGQGAATFTLVQLMMG